MSEPPVTVEFEVVDPDDDRARRSLHAYFSELDRRFDGGFDIDDALADDAAMFRPPLGAFVIGAAGDEPVACGAVQSLGDGIGEIKRMWVAEEWRGRSVGRRMLTALEEQVVDLGFTTVRLDTNAVLTEAIAMYLDAGYRQIERYNHNPYAMCWFEKSLV